MYEHMHMLSANAYCSTWNTQSCISIICSTGVYTSVSSPIVEIARSSFCMID